MKQYFVLGHTYRDSDLDLDFDLDRLEPSLDRDLAGECLGDLPEP